MPEGFIVGALVIVVIVVLVFAGLAAGWARTGQAQSNLPAPPQPQENGLGTVVFAADVFYVATTLSGERTTRIVVHGLAFRGRARVAAYSSGLVVSLAGRPDFFIPRVATLGVGRASWTIDRAIGRDGLIFIEWRLGDTAVDTYFRSTEPDELLTGLSVLAPTSKESR